MIQALGHLGPPTTIRCNFALLRPIPYDDPVLPGAASQHTSQPASQQAFSQPDPTMIRSVGQIIVMKPPSTMIRSHSTPPYNDPVPSDAPTIIVSGYNDPVPSDAPTIIVAGVAIAQVSLQRCRPNYLLARFRYNDLVRCFLHGFRTRLQIATTSSSRTPAAASHFSYQVPPAN